MWTSSTYLGEGLPWSFMHQMVAEFLTAIRAPLEQVGYTSLLHLGTTLKFVWSPLIDLVATKRAWLIATQVLMGGLMLGVAFAAHQGSLPLLWVLLGLLAVLSATHDIACDGFYMQALDRERQALYSGVRVAAFRAAMIIGSAGLVYLAGRWSWPVGFGAAALLMVLLALLNSWLMPRPSHPPRRSATRGRHPEDAAGSGSQPEPALRGNFLAAYRSFFGQPQAVRVLAFMLTYKLGDILMFAMSKPLLRDLGVDTASRGVLNGVGAAVTITSSILGGVLIARKGLARCLVPLTYVQNLAIPLYFFLALAPAGFALLRHDMTVAGTTLALPLGMGAVTLVIVLEQLAAGLGSAVQVVFLMQRCRSAFSASHYAFATAVVALSSTLSGALSGHLNRALGHPGYFLVAFVCSWPALILVWLVPRAPLEAQEQHSR